ncbi:MAG TPA: universal stress protein [Stellaceae bacterium]|nr:universal stress protein [Stellaceae bacterium]
MAIHTILACASGGTATNGTVELASRLARRFEAHVEGFHVRPDPREILMYAGDGFGMPLAGSWIDQFRREIQAAAARTKDAFLAAAGRHGLPMEPARPKAGASASWQEETGYAPSIISRHARFFDLVVLGRSERVVDRPYTDTVEETLIHSGRPVLLAPAQAPATLGDAIAFGWNGSPAAVRALAAAMPLLAAARSVTVITVTDRHEESAAAVVEHLSWHGISAERRVASSSGAGPGEELLAAARDIAADLLVMGGYGQMPWREMLFGGATRAIVAASRLPVLLSH